MKSTAKQLQKEAERAQIKAEQQKVRAKQFMDKGDMESAKIVGAECIRMR